MLDSKDSYNLFAQEAKRREAQFEAVTQSFTQGWFFPAENVNTSCRIFLRIWLAKRKHEVIVKELVAIDCVHKIGHCYLSFQSHLHV